MTEEEKTAMKAVLYLAKKNPRLRYGGIVTENDYCSRAEKRDR